MTILKFKKISKRNQRGILILMLISLMIIFFPRIYFLLHQPEPTKIESYELDNWKPEIKNSRKEFNSIYKTSKTARFKTPPSKFNPNHYSKKQWMSLGLSEKQANVILNFSKRGLKSNNDLKKIFVISDELFNLIKDSTVYDQTTIESSNIIEKDVGEKIIEHRKIEINSASEEELLKLKGIGPFFAKQIIKKRNELGGYVEINQLLEVWKMDEEKLSIFANQLEVDISKINRIDINSVTIEELKTHPYLKWNIANSIIKLRDRKGRFKNIDELKESKLITEDQFEKIKPYIKIE